MNKRPRDESDVLMLSPNRLNETENMFKRKRVSTFQIQALKEATLKQKLNCCTKQDLVEIITNLSERHSQIMDIVLSLIPTPNIDNIKMLFSSLEKKLDSSIPYSKIDSDISSDYSYHRLRPILAEINLAISDNLSLFTSTSSYLGEREIDYAYNSMLFLHYSMQLLSRVPVWQNSIHNAETKHEIYSLIASCYITVIREINEKTKNGKVFGYSIVDEWFRNIQQHYSSVDGHFGFSQVLNEFKSSIGWIIGQC